MARDPEVKFLLKKIGDLKKQGATADSIILNWVSRAVQPMKRHAKPAWSFSRGDVTKEVPDPVNTNQLIQRVEKMLESINPNGLKKFNLAYTASAARPQVRPV